ncbi:MAG: threonylcarbamoyl-AMP synthase [Spirochaetaceae bacterium]|jgi:L-threonylcarbamoyladenylate synthase|nr:threonylcarbamoyl-AMP synthase [Spirochaetaceae bacterium]
MKILSAKDDGAVRAAAEALRAGLLVAFPTETVYGLGADAFNPKALAAVFEAKGRPRFDPLIVHIAELAALDRIACTELLDEAARERAAALTARLWPGPLTLILPKRQEVPDLATSGLSTVAVRFPAHPAAQALIRLSTGAIAAPSANPFGRLSPTRAEHVRDQLGDKVHIILDGGRTAVGVESTVLDLSSGPPRILRPGGVSRERIEALIGPLGTDPGGYPDPDRPPSPGLLKSHYAPRTPLSLHSREELLTQDDKPGEGRLFFDNLSRDAWLEARSRRQAGGQADDGPLPVYRVLSPGGDLSEAAANLFDLLHDLDGLGLRRIRAEEVPGTGLGPAINDRLLKARST